ncbi:MAG: outer membrane lipoprotein-sorting protein [Spirochaetaceae bacterium]|jgi:outer membrane lipoprotein-sorting protein|nr:outer membrane lipoprotein-sorting protein [Spirochaetaceae bacterium]
MKTIVSGVSKNPTGFLGALLNLFRNFRVGAGVFAAALAVVCPHLLYANTADEALLKKVDNLVSYYNTDFSAVYVIVQEKPGQGRNVTEAAVYRRDSKEQYVIVIQKPAISYGQGYLKQGDTLWFYDPESRKFNSTSSKERFQNSNARNSDFTRSTLSEDYRITAAADAQLGRFACRLLTLEAVHTDVTYPRMKIWVSEDGLLRKSEDYSLSGQLLRSSAIPDYYSIKGYYVPKAILLTDEMRGSTINGKFIKEKTQITINNPVLSKLPDSYFSKTYLEQVNK